MNNKQRWEFPLPRTHTGIPLGNGVMGAILWGNGGVLRITVGRADFWDHRGAMKWTPEMSYANIRRYLDKDDQAGISKILMPSPPAPGMPKKPTMLPLGRVDLNFGKGTSLVAGELDMFAGVIRIFLRKGGRLLQAQAVLDMERPALCLNLPNGLGTLRIQRIPAWKYVKKDLEKIGFVPPEMFSSAGISGWVQERPADPPLCLAYRLKDAELYLTTVFGDSVSAAKENAFSAIKESCRKGFRSIRTRTRRWWKAYWDGVPHISIPNQRLQFLYTYGMYKLAGLTNPSGVPATVQGPWIEEYQMPPWGSPYVFNVNVQLCYWPAYHGNKPSHLLPLFEMIFSWQDTLRHNARMFLGIEDGLMLPHATDDRGGCIGGYWAGSIDHGSTGWIALMMYRYYRYTKDLKFLRQRAYPFMFGAMRVYEEMLVRQNNRFHLPISVSPEYVDNAGRQYGKNASYQLACIHALCEALIASAAELGERPRAIWKEIFKKLPKACLVGMNSIDRLHPRKIIGIGIWDGVPLEESHRHHSHLAGITPFDVFDPDDLAWRKILESSLSHWLYHGMGRWSGWCVPWAAMIQTRFGNADTAELYLEIWDRVFTNLGHGTLHDSDFPGFLLMGSMALGTDRRWPEIMQLDGGMGATAAIQEMLLHVRRGVTYLFSGAPDRWKNVAFSGMLTDGAFLVDAEREGGKVGPVTVRSLAGGRMRMANPWPGRAVCVRRGGSRREILFGTVLEINSAPDETFRIEKKEGQREALAKVLQEPQVQENL